MNERPLAARPVRQAQRLAGEGPHGTVVVERRGLRAAPSRPCAAWRRGRCAAARRWSGIFCLALASATPSIGPPATIVRTLPYSRPPTGSRRRRAQCATVPARACCAARTQSGADNGSGSLYEMRHTQGNHRQGSDACKTRFRQGRADDKLHHEDLEIGKPYDLRPAGP